MKKFAMVVFALLVLVIAGALIAPFFIDLNDYKPEITARAKAATGRDLRIDGDIAVSLLPMPSVSVAGVHFGNAPGASTPDMLNMESVSVKVALMPLLSGHIQVKEVVLKRPEISLEKLADGSGNWALEMAQATESTGGSSDSGSSFEIESAVIEGGTITYLDRAAGIEQKIENLNVKLRLDSLQGPFAADGGLTAMGVPLGFSLKTAQIDPNQPISFDVMLRVTEANAELGFSGQIDTSGEPEKPIVSGKVSGKGDSLAKLLQSLPGATGSGLPPAAGQPFSLASEISAGATSAKVENLTATLGNVTAKAGIAANYEAEPIVQANVAIGRLDLDELLPPGENKDQGVGEGQGASEAFSLPSGLMVGADVTIQQIAYRGQAIDDAHVIVQLADGQLNITKASAKLPGSSTAEVSGVLTAEAAEPNFVGGVKLDSNNLRALIEAFAPGAIDEVPADRLRKLAFTSRLAYSPARAELGDIAATLDQSQFSGGIVLALPNGTTRALPGFGVGLSVDKINLDGYLPEKSQSSDAGAKTPDNPLLALAPLADLEANIELRAGALTLNDQQINGLHLLAAITGGKVEITDLSVKDFLGGKGAVSGTLSDLTGDPRYDAKFDITAKEAARVLRMAGMTPPEDSSLGALSLKGAAAGNWKDVDYDVALGMAGIGLQGSAKGKARGLDAGVPKIDTTFDLRAKDVSTLAVMAGVPAATAKQIGAVSANGSATSGADDVSYDMALSMSGIGLQGNVKGTAKGLSAAVPNIDTTFDLKAKNIAPVAALAGFPADAAKDLGAVALAGKAQSGADDLTYDVTLGLDGIAGGGTLKGRVTGLKGDPNVDTALDLKADQPAPLLRMAGLAGPKAKQVGALGVKGTLKGGASNMALDLDVKALGGTAKLNGTVSAKADPIGFDLALAADHPEFSELAKLADLPSSGENAGPLKLRAKVAGTAAKASVSGLDAAWGESKIQGDINYDATGAKPLVGANLSGGVVDVRPFMAPSAKAKKKSESSGAPWSEEPLDLSVLNQQDADIDFAAKSLLMPDQRIDDLVAKITIRNGRLTMNTLQGRIYGGSFDLSGTEVDGQGTPQVRAKAAINQIQMSEVLGEGIAGNQIKGPLSLNLAANGSGASEAEIVRSLRGKGDIGGTLMVIGKVEQTIGSTLLNVLGQKVKQVQGVANTVNGVLSSFTGVDNTISGTFNINKGALVTRDFAFVNPNARGAAQGRIDLGAWAMKLLVDLFGANSDQAFMSLNLTGPVDGPNVGFAPGGAAGPSGLMGLAPGGQFTPNNLLQQIPGVGNLLGGQVQPSAQPVQPTQPGSVLQPGAVQPSITNPNDALQQLLGTQPTTTKKKKKKAVETAPQPTDTLSAPAEPGSTLIPATPELQTAPSGGGVLEPGALPPNP